MSPRPPDCPTEEALSRLFADGQQAEIAAHLDQCPDCAAQWSAMARLRAEARAIATPRLSPVRRDAVRAAVLAETARRAPRRVRRDRRWPAVALAAVAAVLLIGAGLALWPRAAPVAEVHAHAAAQFSRLGDADDDIVRLVEGVVTVEVRPRAPGQRFRVVTGDAEVEVCGTAFDVEARGDRLVGVRVLHGRVAVRCEGQPERLLEAGERWRASPPAGRDEAPAAAPGASSAVEAADRDPTGREAAPGAAAGASSAGEAADRDPTGREAAPGPPSGQAASRGPTGREETPAAAAGRGPTGPAQATPANAPSTADAGSPEGSRSSAGLARGPAPAPAEPLDPATGVEAHAVAHGEVATLANTPVARHTAAPADAPKTARLKLAATAPAARRTAAPTAPAARHGTAPSPPAPAGDETLPAPVAPAPAAPTTPRDPANRAPNTESMLPRSAGEAPAPPQKAEAEWQAGWAALRANAPVAAAQRFEMAQLLDPDGPLAADAAYWQAVARARAGHGRLATRAFARFVHRYPDNARIAEASVMLGWLLLDQGQIDAAEPHFTAGLTATAPRIAQSARAGLAEIGRRRPQPRE